ncbi:response regulator transcription factor [Zoogloea sp.]|uniref:response regulator n=1 Tax=Zoogloea sp. TaxID=49181 RepID=UPI00141674A7|nr:MAG: response regulator transcription factor [Zoogloea sp.]
MPAAARSPLRIVLVEDSALLRDRLTGMLDSIAGIEIAGFADSEKSAIETLLQIQPDLAIIDLELRSGTGLNVLSAAHGAPQRFGQLRTVVFSNHAHSIVQGRCRALGALAFFDKSFQMDELLEYIQAAAERKLDNTA